jgi:predicted ABC-type ATPase
MHIIAGPPGVGKSTRGFDYVDPELDIINEDEMRFKYQQQGYPDAAQQAVFRVREMVKRRIIANEDFAYELNLGYQDQYDYVISAKTFSWENKLNVVLFFTDDIQLCKDRAKARHESGLHLVRPEVIEKMYQNTIPLLKQNFKFIDQLSLVNAEINRLYTVAEYNRPDKSFHIGNSSPSWFKNDLQPFIEQYVAGLKVDKPQVKPWQPPTDTSEERDKDKDQERRHGRKR